MKDLYFKTACDLAENIYKDACSLDDISSISAIAFYDDMKNIVKELLSFEGVTIQSIEFHREDCNGYCKEYLLYLDEKLGLWVEPLYSMSINNYLRYYSDAAYINADCNSTILKKNCNENAKIYAYEYTEDDNSDCDSECLKFDDSMHGFTVSYSTENGFSSYSFHSTDKDLVNIIAKLYE